LLAQEFYGKKLGDTVKSMFEFVIHGRGGQGAKTASEILAHAALRQGKYIQAFSEYGPERTGAPVKSFVRIDDNPITLHSGIEQPAVIAVLDSSLLDTIDFGSDMTKVCVLVVNTPKPPQEIRTAYGIKKGHVYTVDCTSISVEILGQNRPNTPMLGAIVKASNDYFSKNALIEDLENKLLHKIGREMMDKNIACLKRAYDEVKGGAG